ncbi:MAG: guanylate kinase [Bacteroidales bacterium]|nr:guanylate kinase [Bacteroidales bacterium]
MTGKLIIISAPSGSGKTTVVRHLLDLDLGLEFSISATSRQPRGNEQDGRDYYFITPRTFRRKIRRNEFLEWEEVYANQYYGTLRSEVARIWENGHHALFDVDVVGGLNLKDAFGRRALALFISPPSLDVLAERLMKRNTDDEASVRKRIDKARYELTFRDRFDQVIVNDKLEETLCTAEEAVRDFLKIPGL